MSRLKLLFASVLILSAILCAAPALAEQKTPPPPGPPKPPKLPKIVEKRLANGLNVIIAPLPNVPKITAELSFRAGQAADRENHPGIAQLAARVAAEGTDTRSSRQIKEELRSIGGTLSIGTDPDATSMFASSLSEFSAKLF